MPIIPPLRKQKWEDQDFKSSLDNEISYIRPCLKKQKTRTISGSGKVNLGLQVLWSPSVAAALPRHFGPIGKQSRWSLQEDKAAHFTVVKKQKERGEGAGTLINPPRTPQ